MKAFAALALSVYAVVAPARAAAQPSDSVRSVPARPDSVRARRFAVYPLAGLHFGGPVRASVAGGVGWRSLAPGEPVRLFVLAEPGWRGGRLSVVTGASFGSLGSAVTLRGSYLQFWGGAPHRKYVGGELQLMPLLGI